MIPNAPSSAAPLSSNILELYREHRPEIDVLSDRGALLTLGLLPSTGSTLQTQLQIEFGFAPENMARVVEKLSRAGFILAVGGMLSITESGQRFLLNFARLAGAAAPSVSPTEAFEGQKPLESKQLKIFLCHSSTDKPTVRQLYQWLTEQGIDPWLDEEDLLPGQDWQQEIPKAVRASHIVLVCLSPGAVSKTGYLQKEIRYALDIAEEQPDGTIFLIPVKLEPCEVPERLRRWHWVDLYEERGHERLLRALRARAKEIAITL